MTKKITFKITGIDLSTIFNSYAWGKLNFSLLLNQ